MAHKYGELSEQMYHRIYRILQREKDPHIIALALKLPVKTIQNVIERINQDSKGHKHGAEHPAPHSSARTPAWHNEPPVVFLSNKIRFAVIDIGGYLSQENIDTVIEETRTAMSTDFKAFAVRLAEVKSVEPAVLEALLNVIGSFTAHDRYVALLDPSTVVDDAMAGLDPACSIPVFGTERAFEAAAFKVAVEFTKKKSR